MAQAESILSTILCALPAFIPAEPVIASGPVSVTIAISASLAMRLSLPEVTPIVTQPTLLA